MEFPELFRLKRIRYKALFHILKCWLHNFRVIMEAGKFPKGDQPQVHIFVWKFLWLLTTRLEGDISSMIVEQWKREKIWPLFKIFWKLGNYTLHRYSIWKDEWVRMSIRELVDRDISKWFHTFLFTQFNLYWRK